MVKSWIHREKASVPNRKGYATGLRPSSAERWNHFADDHQHGFGWIGNADQQKVSTVEEQESELHPLCRRFCDYGHQ